MNLVRIAIISDIHGNLPALEAVLAKLEGADAVWCLGDVVGYGAEPGGCIDLLADLPQPLTFIAGNHDLAATGGISYDAFNMEGSVSGAWTQSRLSIRQKNFLAAPSETRVRKPNAVLVHASVVDPVWEYINTEQIALRSLERLPAPLCFFGHTHRQMIFYRGRARSVDRFVPQIETPLALHTIGERLLINPGSVGQPRDLDPRAAFLTYLPGRETVTFHRVSYPISEAQRRIRAAGLPETSANRLAVGL